MIAELVSGKTDLADILFLVAAILAVLAALDVPATVQAKISFGWLAVACLAFGWWVL